MEKNNTKIFEQANKEKRENLLQYIEKIVANPVDAEDIAHDTFLWTMKKLEQETEITKESVIGMIYKYCKFFVYDFFKRGKRLYTPDMYESECVEVTKQR